MWVCSTTLARGLPAWMRAWMKNAVASTGYLPSTMLPAPSAITRSDGVISDQCSPCGLTRNSSSWPGTVMLKWLHTPSFKPCRTAARSAVTTSIRAWVMGSLASIERGSIRSMHCCADDAASRTCGQGKLQEAARSNRSGRRRAGRSADARDLAHQLGAHGAAEMLEIVGHDHERTRAADDVFLIVLVE